MKLKKVETHADIPEGYIIMLFCSKCTRLIEFKKNRHKQYVQMNFNKNNWWYGFHADIHHKKATEYGYLVKIIKTS